MAASYFYSYLHLVSSPTVHNRRAGLSLLLCLTGVLGSTKTSQVSSGGANYGVMLGGGHRGALQASGCTRTYPRAYAATRYAVLRVVRPDPLLQHAAKTSQSTSSPSEQLPEDRGSPLPGTEHNPVSTLFWERRRSDSLGQKGIEPCEIPCARP